MQLLAVIVLFGLILEIVEFNEAYKNIRPHKFYNPPPWRSPQWYSFPKAPKHYHVKGIPSTYKYHPYKPDYRRYAPFYEDSVDAPDDDKPYIIVIQLPRRNEKQKSHSSRHLHVAKPIEYARDTTYIDDKDDEVKVYQLDDKKIRIKVNDRLSVLAS